MKKYLFIVAAALLALAACSKVEVAQTPDQPISFEVVNYMTQTRAQGNNFATEMAEQTGGPFFYTNAWYGEQLYMDNVKIELANDVWAPAQAYYWPRTGTVDFFSYASLNDLGSSVVPGGAPGTTFKINDWEVADDDNILIADAVYNAGRTDHNAEGTMITDDLADGTTDSGYNGVPTMFRHLLAQVSFQFGLTASAAHAGTNYEATITSAKVVKVASKGSLTLTNTKSGSSLTTAPWTPASDGTEVGWVADTDTKDIELDTPTLTLAEDVVGNGELVEVLPFISVLPQTLTDDVEIQITFNLDTKHGDTTYIHEEGIEVSAKLNSITTIPSWNMNQRIVYTVTIDPVTEVLTFDPAVAEWETAVEGTINIPVQD